MNKTIAFMAAALMVSTPAFANYDGKTAEEKAEHYMDKMDMNNDGKVSKSEHDAFSNKKFNEADTNNDNMISMDEMTAHKKKKMDN